MRLSQCLRGRYSLSFTLVQHSALTLRVSHLLVHHSDILHLIPFRIELTGHFHTDGLIHSLIHATGFIIPFLHIWAHPSFPCIYHAGLIRPSHVCRAHTSLFMYVGLTRPFSCMSGSHVPFHVCRAHTSLFMYVGLIRPFSLLFLFAIATSF